MAELGNPKNTIEVLQKYQFHFAKKFGQNFLIDTHVLDKIVRAAEITPEDYVLEIGPGIGTLTQYLCESAKHVFAVEIDDNLESCHKGLYVIGDGSGVTHSLSHASASGIYVARHIAEQN